MFLIFVAFMIISFMYLSITFIITIIHVIIFIIITATVLIFFIIKLCFYAVQVKYEFDPKAYSNLLTSDVLADLYTENGLQLGIQFETDPENIRKAGGSTDMGNVSHILPSLHPRYYAGTSVSLHTAEYAKHASKFLIQSF
jgi:metal-dependent amidase/aminoacylase/carboxypeptidase family protein